jgi:IS5 family transposase
VPLRRLPACKGTRHPRDQHEREPGGIESGHRGEGARGRLRLPQKNRSLRSVEIRSSEQTTTFTHGDLAKAMAALLGHEPQAPAPLAINGASEPRADATLRERRTTVIRV